VGKVFEGLKARVDALKVGVEALIVTVFLKKIGNLTGKK
jgi:hypothetical protein